MNHFTRKQINATLHSNEQKQTKTRTQKAKKTKDVSPLDKRIEAILKQDARARDSDNILMVHLLQLHGMKLSAEQIRVLCGFNFESVTRCRRKIQEEGRWLPSPEIAYKRGLKEKNVRSKVTQTNARGTQQLIAENDTDNGLMRHIKPGTPPDVQESLLDLLKWTNNPKYSDGQP